MAQKLGHFSIKRKIGNVEELAEILKAHFDPKFTITIGKADKGIKKFFTDNTTDTITVKKNAYHGIQITLSPPTEGIDFQTIGSGAIVPHALLDQVVGHTGLLDIAICNLIFGNGNDLYDTFEKIVAEQLQGAKVNLSLKNQIKAIRQGKSVFQTAAESVEEKAEEQPN